MRGLYDSNRKKPGLNHGKKSGIWSISGRNCTGTYRRACTASLIKQVPEDLKEGDSIRVFIYRDSQDRPIATTKKPAMELGEVALLTVADVGKIGAFLDWGLKKICFCLTENRQKS